MFGAEAMEDLVKRLGTTMVRQQVMRSIGFLAGFLAVAAHNPAEADVVSYLHADGRTVAPLQAFRECDACSEMIVMPPVSFMMGAVVGESRDPFDAYREGATLRRRGPDEINVIPAEHPRHPVEMDVHYAIGRNEVTHAEWMACVDGGGCTHDPEHGLGTPDGYVKLGPLHPVINVSYLDMLEYVAWLNGQVSAAVYRLPSEVEWEYAARTGTQTRFAQGDDLTADQANISRGGTENLRGALMPELVERRVPVPVVELDAANSWGLRHMAGNVWELTFSCWSEEHRGLATDSAYLALAQSAPSCRRVNKGGSFAEATVAARSARRGNVSETFRRDNRGFRVVRQFLCVDMQ